MVSSMRSRMSSTTLRRSRSLTLAEMTILRFTFSRLMVLGPVADSISASVLNGTLSIIRSPMREAVARSSSFTLTVRSKVRLPS